MANYAGKTLNDDVVLSPSDFMPGNDKKVKESAVLDADPEAQSALILAAMFGIGPGE